MKLEVHTPSANAIRIWSTTLEIWSGKGVSSGNSQVSIKAKRSSEQSDELKRLKI